MIKIYSEQNIENKEIISAPKGIHTTGQEWWMIYDANDKSVTIEPQQCSGYTSSPLTMVISDTKEELEQYISENGLITKEVLQTLLQESLY